MLNAEIDLVENGCDEELVIHDLDFCLARILGGTSPRTLATDLCATEFSAFTWSMPQEIVDGLEVRSSHAAGT